MIAIGNDTRAQAVDNIQNTFSSAYLGLAWPGAMAPVFMMPRETSSEMARGVFGHESIGSSSDATNRREREDSMASVDSHADSPGSDHSAKKRKRASRPKVRTGCITW